MNRTSSILDDDELAEAVKRNENDDDLEGEMFD